MSGDAAERNLTVFAGPFGALYSFYMERERVSRAVARLLWGSDIRPYYASMRAVQGVPEGGTAVDAPCGAGCSPPVVAWWAAPSSGARGGWTGFASLQVAAPSERLGPRPTWWDG